MIAESLNGLIEAEEPMTVGAAPQEGSAEPAEPAAPKQRVYTYNELRQREVSQVPALYADAEGHGIIIKCGIGVVYGPADCGKSMFLRQLCASVAAGKDYIGWSYKGDKRKAIYFSSEDDADITTPVVKINDKSLELSDEAGNNLRYVFDYSADELPELMREMLTDESADLVIVDAFGDAFDGRNTNDTTEIRAFYKKFDPIVKEFGICLIFNHHASKYSASAAPGKASALGSEAIVSRPRFAIELRPDALNNKLVHLCITKGNYIPNELKRNSTVITMNNNLVFYANGDHVPFDDLAKREGATRKKTAPSDFPDDAHKNLLRGIFSDGSNKTQSQLNAQVRASFGISDHPARNFVKYYLEKGFIAESEKKAYATYYKCMFK